MSQTPHSPDQILSQMFATLHAAHANHEIWWVYKNNKDRPKYVDVLNNYYWFFYVSIHAHFVAMLVGICKLHDKSKRAVSFSSLFKAVRRDGRFPNKTLESLEKELKQLEPIIEKAQILRHKFFVHHEKGVDYGQLLDDTEIKYGDYKRILEKSLEILNDLACYFGQAERDLVSSSGRDTRRMLDTLLSFRSEQNGEVGKRSPNHG